MDSVFAFLSPDVAPWMAGSTLTIGSAMMGALTIAIIKGLALLKWVASLLLDLLRQQTEIQRTFAEQIERIEARQAIVEKQVERVVVSLEGHVREHHMVEDYYKAKQVGDEHD